MTPYYAEAGVEIFHGDSLNVLPTFAAARFSRVITDPPYGLGFMGKAWDHGVPGVPFWAECLRVCKPGAMLLAFGGTRTFHRLTSAIEDAGWEIRDCMSWLYGSGFPKSLDISKAFDKSAGVEREILTRGEPVRRMIPGADQDRSGSWIKDNGREFVPTITAAATDEAKTWSGWGTALKPAWEPIIVAMKPLDGTFIDNVRVHGLAGLNIDGARIAGDVPKTIQGRSAKIYGGGEGFAPAGLQDSNPSPLGRWPANVVLDDVAAERLDHQTGTLTSGATPTRRSASRTKNVFAQFNGNEQCEAARCASLGGASRFFYTAKASRSDRGSGNTHATVKPTDLMKHLCTLTATPFPADDEILDPFGGSMTTVVAARELGMRCTAIDIEEEHCAIGVGRLSQGVLFSPEVA